MVTVLHSIDTAHHDMLHDAALDYYGTQLATCSSDKIVKVFDVLSSGQHSLIAELRGHTGPVWQVSWAHPRFGNVLASCSYDRKVIIWREIGGSGGGAGRWEKSYEYEQHDSSVNSVSWAPEQFGLIFGCASSDGAISIVTNMEGEVWEHRKISNAHSVGCLAISWAPFLSATSIDPAGTERSSPVQRIVTGGCDYLVKIFKLGDKGWEEEQSLDGHTDWVRDVAWAPSLTSSRNIIASCSQNRQVIIWTNDDSISPSCWESKSLPVFQEVVWGVSWSITGNILAVSSSDNKVSLWKENLKGEWVDVSNSSTTSVSSGINTRTQNTTSDALVAH